MSEFVPEGAMWRSLLREGRFYREMRGGIYFLDADSTSMGWMCGAFKRDDMDRIDWFVPISTDAAPEHEKQAETQEPATADRRMPSARKDREQYAFELWLDSACPSGDCEQVQSAWERSDEFAEFLVAEAEAEEEQRMPSDGPAVEPPPAITPAAPYMVALPKSNDGLLTMAPFGERGLFGA
jgi:hypothetical protein